MFGELQRDMAKANNTSLGHGIPVQDLDVEECPKVQPHTTTMSPLQSSSAVRYNQLYDEKAFIYDKSRRRLCSHRSRFKLLLLPCAMRRNRWDKGWFNNCWKFWCWPLWPAARG